MTTTSEQRRAWRGPWVLSYGFRPFFFGAGVLAALLLVVWVPWYLGFIAPRSAFSPIDWHVHELLFGYVPAVVAGFLLTAAPNWTGRLPVIGWPLAGLFSLWLLGRGVVLVSAGLPVPVVALVALAFPLALAGFALREIVAGKNWRNLKVLALVALMLVAQAGFYYEMARFGRADMATRAGIAVTILLIMLVAGRIVPSFTRNWIKRANPGAEPAEFGQPDKAAMLLGGLTLVGWVVLHRAGEASLPLALLLALAGAANLWRLLRWVPHRTLAEPLVMVLHAAYAFVPLGFACAAVAAFTGDVGWHQAGVHAFTSGATGLMTLAVMTRASRGHSGRPLTAPLGTQLVYLGVVLAALIRMAAALLPEHTMLLVPLSGLLWVLAYLGFAVLYARILLGPPQG